MTKCNYSLLANKEPIPRTCAVCGLGPCPNFAKDGIDKQTAHRSGIIESLRKSVQPGCECETCKLRIAAIDLLLEDGLKRIDAQQAQPAQPPIGYLPKYELGRLQSGHDANLRSAKFGPSDLDGDLPVYIAPTFADAQPAQKKCAKQMREAGKPSPRTCQTCGLGPCSIAQQAQPKRWNPKDADVNQWTSEDPGLVPAQHAIYDAKLGKVIQGHPYNEAGERKCKWAVRALSEGNPGAILKTVTLYMKAEDA